MKKKDAIRTEAKSREQHMKKSGKKPAAAGTEKHSALSAVLIHLIDQAYSKGAWHGPNLKGSLRGIDAETAIWRPGRGRHSIYELVYHAAYWKYIIWRKLTNSIEAGFELKGSNWFKSPAAADKKGWLYAKKLLDRYHKLARQTILDLPESMLFEQAPNSKYPYYVLICGMASHDLYHAGQIQLLKRISAEHN